MPRPLRFEFEDAWYHVMNRGSNHQNIYKTSSDRNQFLELLESASEIFGIEIHAYCLMDNHYHLLIKTPKANLGRAMQYINGKYTQAFNRIERRDGPLLRGRYKAIVVDVDAYLLQVSRYIHLNPVSANMILSPADYNWSSYRYYLQTKNKPGWLHVDDILLMFSNKKRKLLYKNFVEAGIDHETGRFYRKKNLPVIFGLKEFKKRLLNALEEGDIQDSITDYKKTCAVPSIDSVIQQCASYFGLEEYSLYQSHRGKTNLAREITIYGCRVWAGEKSKIIAKRFNCRPGNVSNIVTRLIYKIKIDEKIASILNHLKVIIFD